MKRLLFVFIVILLIGCRGNETQTQTGVLAPQPKEPAVEETQPSQDEYVIHTVQNEDGTYTCMDNSVKDTAQECLDIAIDIITKQRIQEKNAQVYTTTVTMNEDGTYTCGDGSIVNDSDECVRSAIDRIGG